MSGQWHDDAVVINSTALYWCLLVLVAWLCGFHDEAAIIISTTAWCCCLYCHCHIAHCRLIVACLRFPCCSLCCCLLWWFFISSSAAAWFCHYLVVPLLGMASAWHCCLALPISHLAFPSLGLADAISHCRLFAAHFPLL